MRGAVIGSSLVHLALLVVLLVVRAPRSISVGGADVVQVALIDPSSMPTMATPRAAAEPPKPEPASVAPTEEVGVKLDNPKPKPQAKPEQEPEDRAAPAVQLPYANVGSAGLRGALATDDANFEFTYYLTLVRNRIAGNWSPPTGLAGGTPVRAVVYFRIARDGRVDGARIESASGVEFFDRSAMRALTLSDPLPPLPIGYAGSRLGVHFGFEYQAP